MSRLVHHRVKADAVSLYHADNRDVLARFPDNSVHSVVTDPPYVIESIQKRFGAKDSAPAQHGTDGAFQRQSVNFQGYDWDRPDAVFDADFWREILRVLKPGGFVLSFGYDRTYHRMATAIDDAGFDIRGMIAWVYGSGMPHTHAVPGFDGWRTPGLKPAMEPICIARKPFKGSVAGNMMLHGVGGYNIAASMVPRDGGEPSWPTNLIHDGSDEVLAEFPDAKGQLVRTRVDRSNKVGNVYGAMPDRGQSIEPRTEIEKSAARFFYCAKATAEDKAGSEHPTVKPIKLMRYLTRLVTPPGGIVLDPFAGSGTTLVAADLEGFKAVGCELESTYVDAIRRRFNHQIERTAA